MLALRHTLALRNGRPFSYVNYEDQFAFLPNLQPIAHQFRLKGKHIAYLRGNADIREGTTVVIRDLVTGEATSLCGTAREKIMLIELSTDIVAFFTYVGTVYVASLINPPDSLRAVRLPSSTIHATYTDRGTLACLLGATSGITVFIHDTETRKSTSFTHHRNAYCDESEDTHGHAVLVNSTDKLVDVFSVVNSRFEPKLHIKVVRYSLAGERKAHACLTFWHDIKNFQHVSLGQVLPTGERGLYQLILSSKSHEKLCGVILFDASFDPDTATLKLVEHYLRNTILWKDRLYRVERSFVLIDTARRRAPFDGPQSLRALRNEVLDHNLTSEDIANGWLDDEDGDLSSIPVPTKWCPSSVRAWKQGAQRANRGQMFVTHGQDRSVIPPVKEPATSPEQRTLRPPSSPMPPALSAPYAIIAMNDTFAVGTCAACSYIGVMCFDERVKLHGASLTNWWAHPNHPNYRYRSGDCHYEQLGPGFLALDSPPRPFC